MTGAIVGSPDADQVTCGSCGKQCRSRAKAEKLKWDFSAGVALCRKCRPPRGREPGEA